MPMPTHLVVLETISTFLNNNITTTELGQSFNYAGPLPPISSRADYENFPIHKFPFIGAAMTAVQYTDHTINTLNPIMSVQLIFSNRNPSHDPDALMDDLLDITQQLQTLCAAQQDGNHFGLTTQVVRVDVMDLFVFPTFYTKIEGNKKAYSIGFMSIALHFDAI